MDRTYKATYVKVRGDIVIEHTLADLAGKVDVEKQPERVYRRHAPDAGKVHVRNPLPGMSVHH